MTEMALTMGIWTMPVFKPDIRKGCVATNLKELIYIGIYYTVLIDR
jgi:hypothetical protein